MSRFDPGMLALALLAVPSAAAAQATRDTTSLPEIVVTATRYPVAPDSVAATVTVLRGEDLHAQGIRFVGDALRQAAGSHVVQGGPFGAAASLFMRGGESDYVKVLVDGVPVNQPGGFYDFASLTTDNVERIEILRGPGSVLYGSDAIAGVVQIVTREGDGGVRVGAAGEGGSFGSARWEATALGGGEALGWSAAVSRLTSDGTYALNNDYRNTAASGRLRVAAGERTTLALTGRYHDARYHFPTDVTGAVVDRNQYTTDETASFALDVSHRFSETLDGQLLLARSDIATGYENPADPPPGPAFESSDHTTTDRTSADARLQVELPQGVRGLAGASFEAQRQNVTGAFDEGRDNLGLYAQATVLPLPRLQLTAGGRLDENERFGSFWTYRAAALAFASPGTRVRASVGSGFKEPSFFENFDSPFSVGNPALRPERSFSIEGGIEQDLARGSARVAVTVFAQRFRDLIQFTFVPPEPGGPNYFNVAAADANGFEGAVDLRAGPLRGSVSYTRLWTEVTDAGFDAGDAATFVEGARLLRRPDDAVTGRVESTLAGRLRLGIVLTWVGSRDDIRFGQFPEPNQRVELPSYTTLDLSGVLTVLPARRGRPGLDLTARLENVFDERYEQSVGFPARGRGIFVGASTELR
ncbi:MAG TPA: TonB-dependent receptor [Gemmatimonadales bacterium]|nr:TonB-dependent receptor [Gemmatimonadales bacterium]